MSTGKRRNRSPRRVGTRFLLVLAALLASLASLAPAASADLEFEPGVFAKAHEVVRPTPSNVWIPYAAAFFEESELEAFVNPLKEAAEATQAGDHPDFTTHFKFVQPRESAPPPEHPREVIVDAPAGAIGNPLAVPRCEAVDFFLTILGNCPKESQVGTAISYVTGILLESPVSSLVPSLGDPGLLGFHSLITTVNLKPSVRSDGDYGLRVTASEIPIPPFPYTGSTVTIWGVPYDPIHDPLRVDDIGAPGGHMESTPKPFLSAPTNCSTGPIGVTVEARSWEVPDRWIEAPNPAPEPAGCEQIGFEPSLSARPSTDVADSPSGLEVDVHTPQNETCASKVTESAQEIEEKEEEEVPTQEEELVENDEPVYDCGLATSHLKDTTVTLPAGMSINPSGANGLNACTPQEIGLTTPLGISPQHFTAEEPHCPDASRIGGVEVDTPLLEAPMPGSVYIATPYENPFQSLLAIYIVAEDHERGIVAKLAGKVEADPVTGQLSTTVTDAPQLPFEHFLLHFKQGPHAALRTPPCGEYTTDATLVPYSAPTTAFDRQDSWSISQGPAGSCDVPNAPSIDAGSVTPIAAAATPSVVSLSRADGTQEFSSVNLTLPPGLTGKLAGVEQCSDSAVAAAQAKSGHDEEASPSCPANSRIGAVYVAAGAGPSPYNTQGTAYLTGPYKGAPLSMAIVTPATAGPFDLGTVVVRVALRVDPTTGQITAESDPIPHILQGIPLDVASAKVVLDRPDFTRNGTSCDPSAFSGQLLSTLGQAASLSERFQLAECTSLGFKPKLGIRLFGGTKRGAHPALRGMVRMPEDGANIAQTSVALPHSEFLDQGHIRTVCTRVQFAEGDGNGSACPPGSAYGSAIATSPLVDYALVGNAYLRSSEHELPDLVIALHGPPSQPLAVDVVGRIDSVRGGIRTTFEGVPDLPVSKFVLKMKGGKKGLLQNSTDICQGKHRATAVLDAHNGKTADLRPALRNGKCKKAKRQKQRKGHRRVASRARAAR